MKPLGPMDDKDFILCGICGEENDTGMGYAPDGKNKILWCCRECMEIAPHVYGVIPVKASFYAKEARDRASLEGGLFLEKIGKTDLATLTEQEWNDFLDTLFRARAFEFRRLYAGHVPPF